MSSTRINGTTVSSNHEFTPICFIDPHTTFHHLCHLRIYATFQQDNVITHIVNNSLHFLLCFWPNQKQMIMATMFTRLQSVQFCLSLILTNKMCSNIPHTKEYLKEKHYTCNDARSVRRDVRLQAERNHFQHLT